MQNEQEMIVTQTDSIVITAGSELVDSYINNQGKEFVWGYYFCIENNSDEKITLLGKNWNITDSNGNSFCDDSLGFSGEMPELEPGEYFEFSSTAPIQASNAVFYGSCKIIKGSDSKAQNIQIPVLEFQAQDNAIILN